VNKVAVVVVDMQRDFLDPTTPAKVGSWEKAFCVPGVRRLVECAREREWQVVHVGTQHRDRSTLPQHHRTRGIELYCAEGGPGCEFVVAPAASETVMFKHWYSAFDAGLEGRVDQDTRIIWAGVASDCCIQQSAFEADRRGIRSVVPYQSVSASSSPAFVGSLVGMAKSVCDVVDLADVTGDLGVAAPFLDVEAIEDRAERWYRQQISRLGEASSLSLAEVVKRLAE
jgi:nicotinamidase-related amidase